MTASPSTFLFMFAVALGARAVPMEPSQTSDIMELPPITDDIIELPPITSDPYEPPPAETDVPIGVQCGDSMCDFGMECCNPSCGICALQGSGGCVDLWCEDDGVSIVA